MPVTSSIGAPRTGIGLRTVLAGGLLLLCLKATAYDAQEMTLSGPSSPTPGYDLMIRQFAETYFDLVPEQATYHGFYPLRYAWHERWNDRSPAGDRNRRQRFELALEKLKRFPTHDLTADQRLTLGSMIGLLDGLLAPGRVVDYGVSFGYTDGRYLPYGINHLSGPLVDIPWLLEVQQPVSNESEARAYIQRLKRVGATLGGAIASMKRDVELGVVPPDFILARTISAAQTLASMPTDESPLYTSFVNKIEGLSIESRDRLVGDVRRLVDGEIRDALLRTVAFLKSLRPEADSVAGIWRLPNGDELYRALIRQMTDEEGDPEEIHALGLREVERISKEIDQLLIGLGHDKGTVGQRLRALSQDPAFKYPAGDEGRKRLLADIAGWVRLAEDRSTSWFDQSKSYRLEVRRIPEHNQANAGLAYYDSPSQDGSRPGIFWINLMDPSSITRFGLPTLTYHETIPGHHLQVARSMAKEQAQVEKVFWSNAAGEGWALYAEQLALEMGLYEDDPYGNIGRLQDELHRAIRLVVDTGIHAKRWGRAEAVRYMADLEGISDTEANNEIDRYVVWPAKALSYTLGMKSILNTRAEAERILGCHFDVRAFHNRVLGVSPASLSQIRQSVMEWVASMADAKRPNVAC